jgi:hypothetical protein
LINNPKNPENPAIDPNPRRKPENLPIDPNPRRKPENLPIDPNPRRKPENLPIDPNLRKDLKNQLTRPKRDPNLKKEVENQPKNNKKPLSTLKNQLKNKLNHQALKPQRLLKPRDLPQKDQLQKPARVTNNPRSE